MTESMAGAGEPRRAVFVAELDGRVSGVITLAERPHFSGQTDAYVGELIVAAGLERRGMATGLRQQPGRVRDTGAVPDQTINAVVFDLGGVLIDWDPRYLYRQLFADPAEMEDFLARVCTSDWHRAHDLGEDITASCRRLAEQHPGHKKMIMAWAERGEEMAAGQLDSTVQVLWELKAAGMPCFALSNMEPDAFAIRRARFPFMKWFDGHVISGLEGVAKPDPRIFKILLERHGLDAPSTVFVDDQERNVAAAGAIGLTALRFTSAPQLSQDLLALGVTGITPPL